MYKFFRVVSDCENLIKEKEEITIVYFRSKVLTGELKIAFLGFKFGKGRRKRSEDMFSPENRVKHDIKAYSCTIEGLKAFVLDKDGFSYVFR